MNGRSLGLILWIVAFASATAAQGLPEGSGKATFPVSPQVRSEPATDDYLTGYLKAPQGRPIISWKADGPTQSDAGVTAEGLMDTRPFEAGWSAATESGRVLGVEFAGEPSSRNHWLNVSRMIHVELHRKAPSCTSTHKLRFDIELLAGEQVLGDALNAGAESGTGGRIAWSQGDPRPRQPVGYCDLHFRLYPRLDRIDGGTSLKLRVWQYSDSPIVEPAQFGLQDEAQSLLRIPTLPFEDALYRHADFVGIDDLAAYETHGPPIANGFAALSTLLLLTTRVKGRAWIVGMLVVVTLSPGCMGPDRAAPANLGPTSDLGGSGESTVIDPAPGVVIGVGKGVLFGLVRDELDTPVPAANVLLATGNFTQTDSYGRYKLPAVSSGTYLLRVDVPAGKYRSFEGKVDVLDGKYTRFNVRLEAVEGLAEGARRHHHESEWTSPIQALLPTKTPVTFQEKVQAEDRPRKLCLNPMATQQAEFGRLHPAACLQEVPLLPVDANQPLQYPKVLPGTREVRAVVDWAGSSENTVERVGLIFRNRDANYSVLAPRPAGTVFHIPVAWEWADRGHQRMSDWRFWIYVLSTPGSRDRVEGTFAVSMEIEKGAVPYEPPHPDPWGDNRTAVVFDALAQSSSLVPGRPGQCRVAKNMEVGQTTNTDHSCLFTPHEPPMPADTVWVFVNVTHQGAGGGAPDAMPFGEAKWMLRYQTARPGQEEPWDTPLRSSHGEAPQRLRYWFCIRPSDSDGQYATRTAWRFWMDDGTDEPTYINGDQYFALKIIAHVDTPPAPCNPP